MPKNTVIVPTGFRAELVREKRGRPPINPTGTRNRTLRLTDSEYAQVKEFVKKIRTKTT